MLQTGHGGFNSLVDTAAEVDKAVSRTPSMPVINAEVNYEGIFGQSWQDVQRLSFYISVFHGTAGHTYGANGLWQVNKKGQPYGLSPHGANWGYTSWKENGINWGNMPWEEAAELPGGMQVALGGRFIRQFPWWKLEKHSEWADAQMKETGWKETLCVGIPRQLRLIYVPQLWIPPRIKEIEQDISYSAYYFDPCTGTEYSLGTVHADEKGEWQPAFPPEVHDWIIVLKVPDSQVK
jgi:hypothetical protein